ncbi:MAG TPA: hypothetical protein DCQ79_11425, partial [Rhizobiales bacterium]|nr:hypothetical protein [Hyphomicrobiales bacterium]
MYSRTTPEASAFAKQGAVKTAASMLQKKRRGAGVEGSLQHGEGQPMASLSGPVTACALGLLCALAPSSALTAPCGGDFNAWLEDFSK